MANDEVRGQYQALSEKGEYLQHKQQTGGELSDEEIAAFEKERQTFLDNPWPVVSWMPKRKCTGCRNRSPIT